MPTFTYQARDDSGRRVKGVLEADSLGSVAGRLRKMGYLVTRMEEVAATAKRGVSLLPGGGKGRVAQEPLLLAALQLANLVEAGVPLISGLQTVASLVSHPSLKEALEGVVLQIEGGTRFSQALSSYPRVFPKLMVSMAAVGEQSGHLDTVLARFADSVEKDLALTRSVRGALLYPILLLAAAVVLILFVVAFVVPQFATVFAKAGVALPLPTRILQGMGTAIRSYSGLLVLLTGGVFFAGEVAARTAAVRLLLDRGIFKVPLVGPMVRQVAVARFARTLGTLVQSGVSILAALETAAGVVENAVIRREIGRVSSEVERGERIGVTLGKGKVFPPDTVQMIRVGEESGRLDTMLERIADVYEKQVSFALKQLTTVLEPILLIGMGGVIAFIMASLLLPMFDMVKVLQRGGIR